MTTAPASKENLMLEAHPAAEMFPLMEGAELDALVADIRLHGLKEPIVLADGKILDGRNRYRACIRLQREPSTIEWNSEGTPEAFVASMNLHRRHLTGSQRALIAARLATRTREETLVPNAASRSREELDTGKPATSISISQAASMLNVNKDTVSDAKFVLKAAEPEEIAAVERGDAAVSSLARHIRENRPPAERKSIREGSAAHPGITDRTQTQRRNADLWGKLRVALEALAEMPAPEDTARIAAGFAKRAKFPMQTHLTRTQAWLRDFEEHYDA